MAEPWHGDTGRGAGHHHQPWRRLLQPQQNPLSVTPESLVIGLVCWTDDQSSSSCWNWSFPSWFLCKVRILAEGWGRESSLAQKRDTIIWKVVGLISSYEDPNWTWTQYPHGGRYMRIRFQIKPCLSELHLALSIEQLNELSCWRLPTWVFCYL